MDLFIGALMSSYSDSEKGQGLIEYALLIALVALAAIAVMGVFGPVVGNVFSNSVAGL